MVQNAAAEHIIEPLFRSAHDALKFAFLFSGQQYPLTIMAKMMRGIVGSGKGLVGLDGALQAGLICLMVKELPVARQDALVARYAVDSDPRWIDAVRRLAVEPTVAPSGVSNRLERQALVARYFGAKVNIGEVAEKVGVDRRTVGNHQRAMRDKLRILEELAYGELTDIMASRGVIE